MTEEMWPRGFNYNTNDIKMFIGRENEDVDSNIHLYMSDDNGKDKKIIITRKEYSMLKDLIQACIIEQPGVYNETSNIGHIKDDGRVIVRTFSIKKEEKEQERKPLFDLD